MKDKINKIYEKCIEGINDEEYSSDIRNEIIFWLEELKDGLLQNEEEK